MARAVGASLTVALGNVDGGVDELTVASGNVDGGVDVGAGGQRWRRAMSTAASMLALAVSESVDGGVDGVAAGQGVDGSVAVDDGVGESRRRRQCWRCGQRRRRQWCRWRCWRSGRRRWRRWRCWRPATISALAVFGGGDRYTVDGGVGQRRRRRRCWSGRLATASTVVSIRKNLVESASHSNTRRCR